MGFFATSQREVFEPLAPITYPPQPLYPGESQHVDPGQTRIALLQPVSDNQKLKWERFAYQLGHELTHVKLGDTYNSYLIETFAVAMSFKVLKQIGAAYYRDGEVQTFLRTANPEVADAVKRRDWTMAAALWQAGARQEDINDKRNVFPTLGALILEAHGEPNWASLGGLGLVSRDCSTVGPVHICQPDIETMCADRPLLKSALRDLGYTNCDSTGVPESSKVIVVQDSKPQSKNQTAAKPVPPTVFILSNGDRVESSHYILTVDSVKLDQGETQSTIPISAINMNATIAANRKRGIDLKFPRNRAEIMLGF